MNDVDVDQIDPDHGSMSECDFGYVDPESDQWFKCLGEEGQGQCVYLQYCKETKKCHCNNPQVTWYGFPYTHMQVRLSREGLKLFDCPGFKPKE